MVIFDAINIFSKGTNTMATPAEQLKTIQQNLALAKANGDTQKVAALEKSQESVQALVDVNNGTFNSPTNTATSGVVQDANGGFTETSPSGTVIKYNSEGIMYSMTEPNGTVTRAPNVAAEPDVAAQLAEINANMSKPKVDVPLDQMLADAKAAQDANNAKLGIVQDPVAAAESAKITAQLAEIDANRKVQADAPARVDTEGIAAAAAAQNANQKVVDQQTAEVVVGGPIAASSGTVEEKKIIKPADDAQVAKTAQEKLEAEQESNRAKLKAESAKAGNPEGNWTAGSVDKVRTQQAVFVARNSIQKDDWRVRLSLAPSAKYLYKAAKAGDILYPLAATDGVIFPYSPTLQTAYRANYDPLDLMHSNYKLHFYKNSNVDEITITADFTAQDTTEANYLLAVIHFFKSVTKMFYGQDGNNGPKAGTPPPLCYLNGYGQYQFNEHPCLVSSFTYNLPNDVDYIRAGAPTVVPGTNTNSFKSDKSKSFSFSDLFSLSKLRAQGSRLKTNSISAEPAWKNYSNENATYVPTKMQIQLSLIPVVTRNDISKNFSLEKYATGALLKGRTRSGGGMW